MDTTISGSRNGLTPLFLWYAIRMHGKEGMQLRVDKSLAIAAYALESLKAIGIKAWRNPNAITVVFPSPPAEIRERWQLASDKGQSHLIAVPGVERVDIDNFVDDLKLALGHRQGEKSCSY